MAKIKKVYQKRFTTVDNTILNDESVSWKAKGLFTYLWSKPDNWNYSVKEVSKHAKDGRDSTSDGVQELEEHGYLKREQINKKGSFGSSVWTLSERPIFKKQVKNDKPATPNTDNPLTEEPVTGNPSTDLPMTEKSSTENPALLNTELLNTDSTNNGITNKSNNKYSASHGNALSESVLKNSFEEIWKDYPNKKGKKEAFNHYKAWRKKSVKNTDEYLITQLKKYLIYCEQRNSWYHPMNGSTWFNGRFDDVLVTDGIAHNSPKNRWYNRQPINEPMPAWWDKQQEEEAKPQQHVEKIDDSGDPMPDD